MGTRGLLAIRNNKQLLSARFNGMDSYYSHLGGKVLDYYFWNKGENILELTDNDEDDRHFLQDGLFCEYAYVYNKKNDTLEIYRGFFKTKQGFNVKEQIINNLEENHSEKYFCHLIIIVDKKIHTRKDVLKAFREYADDKNEGEVYDYPERKIIPLKINRGYIPLV